MTQKNLDFDFKGAHRMVRKQQAAGNDVKWDGWDIVFYRADPAARTSKHGVWRNGEYAFENRFSVNSEGIWKVDGRNLKRTRSTRNRPR